MNSVNARAGAAAPELPGFADVKAAAARLAGVARRTPVMTSRTADERTGAQIFFKCENLQRMGAFKFRALQRHRQPADGVRQRGVSLFSGNQPRAWPWRASCSACLSRSSARRAPATDREASAVMAPSPPLRPPTPRSRRLSAVRGRARGLSLIPPSTTT